MSLPRKNFPRMEKNAHLEPRSHGWAPPKNVAIRVDAARNEGVRTGAADGMSLASSYGSVSGWLSNRGATMGRRLPPMGPGGVSGRRQSRGGREEMWKKDEELTETAHPQRESEPRPERSASVKGPAGVATIGRSISIHGEVTGDEDLLIQGRVEGSIDLKQHSVTVGPDGEVKASIVGRVVTVEGKVKGNLTADEQIILKSSASVDGDIAAPRVVLQDGARFRGGAGPR